MNQNPEQLARDRTDDQLTACGWILQNKKSFNLAVGIGVTIREHQTDAGPTDYIPFVNRKPVWLIEANREEECVLLTVAEEQSTEYVSKKLKYLKNDTFSFVYESIGNVTHFVNHKERQTVQKMGGCLIVCDKGKETTTNGLKQAEALR